jgi:hypothetical protein
MGDDDVKALGDYLWRIPICAFVYAWLLAALLAPRDETVVQQAVT